MVQLSSSEVGNADRGHRQRLLQWAEADQPIGGHIRGETPEAREGKDEGAQDLQRAEGFRLHPKQRGQAG